RIRYTNSFLERKIGHTGRTTELEGCASAWLRFGHLLHWLADCSKLDEEPSMDQAPASDSLHPKYRRVVLKLSGEGFGLRGKSGISIDETLSIARQAQRVVKSGVQLAIVVGGGNILRGAQFSAGGEVIK